MTNPKVQVVQAFPLLLRKKKEKGDVVVHRGIPGPPGPPPKIKRKRRSRGLRDEVLECCTWSLNLEGLLECLRMDGIRRVWVELQDREELPPDYFGPARFKVLAVVRDADAVAWATSNAQEQHE